MDRYEGIPCSHCGEKFTKDSDVVVCPHCGAPYHRSCYQELGKCKFSDKHSEGYEWQMPLDQLPPERITVCLKCKTPNPKENVYCSNCHAKLSQDVKVISVIKNEDMDEKDLSPTGEVFAGAGSDISAAEVTAYTGKKAAYFLNRFRPLASGKSTVSWNWPAFFFKFFYFFYKRMYLVGIIALMLYAMLAAPSVMYAMEVIKMNSMELFGVEMAHNAELMRSLEMFIPTVNILNIVYSVCCGLFANKLYMKKVFKDIRTVKEKVQGKMDVKEYLYTLGRVGKPDWLSVAIVLMGFLSVYLKSTTVLLDQIIK